MPVDSETQLVPDIFHRALKSTRKSPNGRSPFVSSYFAAPLCSMANETYIETWVYPGDTYWSDGATPAEEMARKRAEAAQKIRSLFDAGTPFYTKEVIRDVCQQLEKFGEKGQKVSVRGFDEVIVDFDIESGLILEYGESDLEFIVRVYRARLSFS